MFPLQLFSSVRNAFKPKVSVGPPPSTCSSPQSPLHHLLQAATTNDATNTPTTPAHLISLLNTWISTICLTSLDVPQALTQLLAFLAHPSTQYALTPLTTESACTAGVSHPIKIIGIYLENSADYPKPPLLITTFSNQKQHAALLATIQALQIDTNASKWSICYQRIPTTAMERLTFPWRTFLLNIFQAPQPPYVFTNPPLYSPNARCNYVTFPLRLCSLHANAPLPLNPAAKANPPALPPELSLLLNLPFLPENTALHLHSTPETPLSYPEDTHTCPTPNTSKLLEFLQTTPTSYPFTHPLPQHIPSYLLKLQVRYCLNYTESLGCYTLTFHITAPFSSTTNLPDFQYYLSSSYRTPNDLPRIHTEICQQFVHFLHAYLTMYSLYPLLVDFSVQPAPPPSDIATRHYAIRLHPYSAYTLHYSLPSSQTPSLKLILTFSTSSSGSTITLHTPSGGYAHTLKIPPPPENSASTTPPLEHALNLFGPPILQELHACQALYLSC